MIVIIAALLGVLFGARAAHRHKGNRLDMAQYAAGYAIAFALVGLMVTIGIEKLL